MYYYSNEFVVMTKNGEEVCKTFSYGSRTFTSSLDAMKKKLDARIELATRFSRKGMLYSDSLDWFSHVTDISVTKTDKKYEITGNFVYTDGAPGTVRITFPILVSKHEIRRELDDEAD